VIVMVKWAVAFVRYALAFVLILIGAIALSWVAFHYI